MNSKTKLILLIVLAIKIILMIIVADITNDRRYIEIFIVAMFISIGIEYMVAQGKNPEDYKKKTKKKVSK